MNVETGEIYPSLDEAIKAGEDPNDLVTGPEKTLRKLRRNIRYAARTRNGYNKDKKRLKMQKESRKRNR